MNQNKFLTGSQQRQKSKGLALLLIALIPVVALLLLLTNYRLGQAAPKLAQTAYLPMAATSSRTRPPAAYATSIRLDGALCPNDIAVNQTSGLVYITNEYSDNISLLRGTDYLGNIATGKWPIWVESDPNSERVYVSNVVSGVTVMDGEAVKNQIAPYVESYNMTINTVNGYTYVTDLHRPITIIKDDQRVADLFVPRFEGFQIEWQLASAFDEKTGLTYFASWQRGAMSVVDGLEVVDQFPYLGTGAKDMVIDSYRRLLYTANFRAGEDGRWLNNVSVVDTDTKAVTAIFTAKNSRHLALDAATGYLYATNPVDDTVTVLRGYEVIGTYQAGKAPWGVAVDPMTGYAYVANSGEHSVSVFHNGLPITTIELPLGKGFEPWQVAVDPQSGRVYVISRSSTERPGENALNRIVCKQPWVHVLQ